jgi:hypothetical protein
MNQRQASAAVSMYLEMYHDGFEDVAVSGLIDSPHRLLPLLCATFKQTQRTDLQLALVDIAFQRRNEEPPDELLGLAQDSDHEVVRQAAAGYCLEIVP